MKFGFYKNKLNKKIFLINKEKLKEITKREILEEKDSSKSDQIIKISLGDYSLILDKNKYPIAVSNSKILKGNFILLEKWINPYWKTKSKIFLPNRKNPLGKYLIILAKEKTGEKIKQSIHSWPKPPYGKRKFLKGNFGNGCIRMKPNHLKKVFKKSELGSKIIIN